MNEKQKVTTYIPVADDVFAGLIGEGVHTGLRKGSEAPSSGPLWQAINASDDDAWGDAAYFCVQGLKSMGYKLVKEA